MKHYLILSFLSLAACSGGQFKTVDSSSVVSGSALAEETSGSTQVGIVNKFNMYPTFAALTGTTPSTKTRNVYVTVGSGFARGSLLPATAEPIALNGPALMLTLVAATEHCRDLMALETDPQNTKPKLLTGINLSGSQMLGGDFNKAAQIFAQRFWNRPLKPDEEQRVSDLYHDLSADKLTNVQLLNVLCAGQISSLASTTR